MFNLDWSPFLIARFLVRLFSLFNMVIVHVEVVMQMSQCLAVFAKHLWGMLSSIQIAVSVILPFWKTLLFSQIVWLLVVEELLVLVIHFDWAIDLIEGTHYGNGVVANIGNETGGIQITLTADLKYNDLKDVVQTGMYTPPFLSTYLYEMIWFLWKIVNTSKALGIL